MLQIWWYNLHMADSGNQQGENLSRVFPSVMVHSPSCPPPSALMRALSNKGVVPSICTDVFSAMAKLARLARTAPASPCVLVVIEPSGVSRSSELIEAVERNIAGARCWAYEESANPSLRAIVLNGEDKDQITVPARNTQRGEQCRTTEAPAPSQTPSHAGSAPLEHDVDESGDDEALHVPEGEPSDVLTSQELAMLLGDDEDERS